MAKPQDTNKSPCKEGAFITWRPMMDNPARAARLARPSAPERARTVPMYSCMVIRLGSIVGAYSIGSYKRNSDVRTALKAAEMGLKLRGARDVDVGMFGSLGVDQGERPNNIGCC